MPENIETESKNQNGSVPDNRARILEAASQLFLEGGAAALSVRAISKRAGLSTIGIYSYFNGKQGVLDALYIEGFNKVYDAMNVNLGDGIQIQHVLGSCENYLRMAHANEAHYRLIFGESDMGYAPSTQARDAGTRAFKKLVSNTGEYIAVKGLNIDKLHAALDVWAVLHGYVSISHHAMANEELDWFALSMAAVERQISSWQ